MTPSPPSEAPAAASAPSFAASAPPVDVFDALLLDLDGVLYVGPHAVPHAAQSVSAAHERGSRLAYVTNNASRPPAIVAEHLAELGLPVTAADVVTSAQAGADLMAGLVAVGSRVLAVGGDGVAIALAERGFEPVRDHVAAAAAVMQGFGPHLQWHDLAGAAYVLATGVPWVATNLDLTVPTPHGIAPGNGSFVRMLAGVVRRDPDAVAGKPEPPLVRTSIERVGASRPLMVGDRLDTDIAAGHRTAIPSLLVLTGVTDAATLLAAPPQHRPSLLAVDLRGLHEPHPGVELTGTAARPAAVACADARAELADGHLTIAGPARSPADVAALWRAAATLAWALPQADRTGVVRRLDAARAALT